MIWRGFEDCPTEALMFRFKRLCWVVIQRPLVGRGSLPVFYHLTATFPTQRRLHCSVHTPQITSLPTQWWTFQESTLPFSTRLLPQAVCVCACVHALSSSVTPTLCDPMDHGLPGTSVHGVSHARILECVAFSYSKGSSRPRYWPHVSCISRRILHHWATRETLD